MVLVCLRCPAQVPDAGSAPVLQSEHLGDVLAESGALEPGGLDVAQPAAEPRVELDTDDRRRAGRWKIAPHLDVRGTYDDNIFIQPRDEVADYILTIAPGAAVGIWDSEERLDRFLDRERPASFIETTTGNFLLVDYTAILLGFAKTESENALDHQATFDAQWQGERLTLGGKVAFESRSETNVDIGGRVRRETFTAVLRSRYEVSEKTALEVSFSNVVNEPEGFLRTVEWRNEDYVEYAVTPLVRAAVGGALGRIEVEQGDEQTYEQIVGRLRYSLTEKLNFEGRAGVEFRQSGGAIDDQANPVVELVTEYDPAPATRLRLDAFRRVEVSAAAPQDDYTLTGVSLAAERAIRVGWYLGVSGGYRNSDYRAFAGETERRDDHFFVRPRLLYNYAEWGNAEISYEFRRNDSTRAESSFDNEQVSLQLSVIY